MKRLAIVITHPIQYYVPIFRLLAKECNLKVFYTWGVGGIQNKYDPGFGKEITWDLPLLNGYTYELLENTAKVPGSHHGKGIVNPDIIKKIKDFIPNAILIYGYSYHSHFKVMRYFKGKIPVWFRGDSTLLNEVPSFKAYLKKIYLTWVYSHVDKAFYVGNNNKAYFKKYGLKEHQLIFAPHAVDNEHFSESRKKEADELRASLGINANDILILFAGKFELTKSPELLLDAFIEILMQQENCNKEKTTLNKDRNIHLLFVGNGILEESLKTKAFSNHGAPFLETTNRIHFRDFQNQSQMPSIYQACDLFCLPSQEETWGLAINEAMAAGKPILASNKVGCTVDLVQNNNNGLVFISGSKNSLINSIKNLVTNYNKLISFGKNSSKIIKKWSFSRQLDAIINEINQTH